MSDIFLSFLALLLCVVFRRYRAEHSQMTNMVIETDRAKVQTTMWKTRWKEANDKIVILQDRIRSYYMSPFSIGAHHEGQNPRRT
jgi:hypothetical protein